MYDYIIVFVSWYLIVSYQRHYAGSFEGVEDITQNTCHLRVVNWVSKIIYIYGAVCVPLTHLFSDIHFTTDELADLIWFQLFIPHVTPEKGKKGGFDCLEYLFT